MPYPLIQDSWAAIHVSATMSTSQSDSGKRGASGSIEEIRATKASIRKRIEGMLKLTDKSRIDAGSAAVAERLLATPQLDEARVVSVYLSMPQEMGTAAVVSDLFKRGKKVYIPKVSVAWRTGLLVARTNRHREHET